MANFRTLLDRVKAEIDEIDAAQAKARLDAGAAFVDVREPTETADGHIANALLIPRGLL